jgi:hypothetical protein
MEIPCSGDGLLRSAGERVSLSAGLRLNGTVERHGEGESVSHARRLYG